MSGELQKVAMKAKDLKWATITAMFNEKYKQNRSKVQVYSHWRNYTVLKKNRVFSAAEEEAVRALDEIKMPLEHVARLMGKRSVNQIEVKLAKMLSGESAPVVDPEEAKRRAKFRERVKSVVLDSGWLMAEDTVSQELVERMNTLVTIDPNLLKNSHPIGVGRPKKPKTVDDDAFSRSIYGELAMMLRPFSYVNNRRKRTTCLPGDGRRYGLNLFAVSRLLGSPFDIERLPKETDDALSMGVKEVDLQSFVVMRDLMAKNHNKAMHDRLGYNQIPDTSPIVSLLPPMLFTVTGIRSVLLYRDTLRYVVENEDGEQAAKVEECSSRAHDLVSEADDKLVQMLDSFFFFPWSLLTVNGDGNDNSDVETDSDEDQVWCEKDETLEEDCWY